MSQTQTMPDRPSTILDAEALAPRAPLGFLGRALRGGLSFWGLQLIAAWAAFQSLTAISWATHLGAKVGNSAIADGWGEKLTAGGLWEMMGQGGLRDSPLGVWTAAIGAAALAWALWAGWKMQAGAVGLNAGLLPWLAGIPAALLTGGLPLFALHASLWKTLPTLAGTGIQALGWADLVGGPLLRMSFWSALMLQWWLCRLALAYEMPKGARQWLSHFRDSFLCVWAHPVHWGAIVFFGVAARSGLSFSVLCLGWNWGGGEPRLVWAFALLQTAAASCGAWLIGLVMRMAALYWKSRKDGRAELQRLESMARQRGRTTEAKE